MTETTTTGTTLEDVHRELRDYARALVEAGFTVYAPGFRWAYLCYREPTGQFYGHIQHSLYSGWDHDMPIKPSREFGSSIRIDPQFEDPFTIEAALAHAKATNVGIHCGGRTFANHRPWTAQDSKVLAITEEV